MITTEKFIQELGKVVREVQFPEGVSPEETLGKLVTLAGGIVKISPGASAVGAVAEPCKELDFLVETGLVDCVEADYSGRSGSTTAEPAKTYYLTPKGLDLYMHVGNLDA